MKKISVYVKGNRNAPTYYRIYQYFDNINNCSFKYRQMFADWVHDKFMPFSQKPIYIKIFAQLHSYLRVLLYLIKDFLFTPDVLIIHRRVLTRYMPISYKFLLKNISKHCKILWDFDDNILDNKEVNRETFLFYAKITTNIIVTNNFLKGLIPDEYHHKVIIMPTTDGDMYKEYTTNSSIDSSRLQSFDNAIELVWVATSVNIPFLKMIAPHLDETAKLLKNKYSKNLILNVVCNAPLHYESQHLIINNIKWTHDIAIQTMYKSHIGIMPLEDNDFTRGKGGFKLVQYMSAGLPCIASNVGFNNYVVSEDMGCLVNNNQEWIDAIISMCDKSVWEKLSKAAYTNWHKKFSFEKNLEVWRNLITE